MLVSVVGFQTSATVDRKLEHLGVKSQRGSSESVVSLNKDTVDMIYLVSFDALGDADWPRLRVRLAQANRYYIVVGAGLNSQAIMNAARDGAFDALLFDDSDERWQGALQKVVDAQKLWLQLYGGAGLKSTNGLLGQSTAMKSLRQTIERLGPTGASVLILGESGVGKEMVANALHIASGRGPFVAVNCAAIPKELMEAELFGAERGAYTGALKTRQGLVEQAANGTLFLDEIGEMDLRLQPKLLRFLETRKTRRVGGNEELQSEVRVLAATNSNLETEISQGKFRSDLYYRISEVILHVTPLRTRPEDIAHLSMVFMKSAGERLGKHFDSMEPELIEKLRAYEWPGNVRELRNVIDRMIIMYDGPVMRAAWWDVPTRPVPAGREHITGMGPMGSTLPAGGWPASMNRKQKLEMARQLLESSGNDLTWVAAQLGIHPTTLYRWRKMKKL
ncbi:MAG TPA: sigma-54 dependent transcriptional regulator [Candidatus Nitrosotalea sp.]|nr:sigma-54 dependent transcriptional regulator [Candidatus Nitrosotalea sp.]